MENEESIPNPAVPPELESHDGSADLMEAIGCHPEAARALATIAGGADPREVLSAWLESLEPQEPAPDITATAPSEPPATEPESPEPAIYQSAATLTTVDDSWPACLSTPKSGFWDNLQFI